MIWAIAVQLHVLPWQVARQPFHSYWAIRCEYLIAAKREREAMARVKVSAGDDEDVDVDKQLGITGT